MTTKKDELIEDFEKDLDTENKIEEKSTQKKNKKEIKPSSTGWAESHA